MDELVNTVQSMSKSTNDIDIKLPIVFPPPICYALFAADKLAIIMNNPSAMNWIYNNFIQLVFYSDNL